MSDSLTWQELTDRAQRLEDPTAWRRDIAEGLHALTGCPAVFFTCAPGNLMRFVMECSPESSRQEVEPAFRSFIPQLAQRDGKLAFLRDRGALYAISLDEYRYKATRDLHLTLLEPAGLSGFVCGFSMLNDGPVVAWFVLRSTEPAALLERFREPLEQLRVAIGEHVGRVLALASAFGSQAPLEGWQSLSLRELQIAQLVAEGHSNLNVATQAGIAESTVAVHLRRIYRKLKVHSRAQLTRVVVDRDAPRASGA